MEYTKVILASNSEAVDMKSLGAKVAGTVVIILGWLAITVLCLAYLAEDFDLWQKLAIFIASRAIVMAIVAVMWIRWALK